MRTAMESTLLGISIAWGWVNENRYTVRTIAIPTRMFAGTLFRPRMGLKRINPLMRALMNRNSVNAAQSIMDAPLALAAD